MFRYSFNLPEEARAIEEAVDAVLNEGWDQLHGGVVHQHVLVLDIAVLLCQLVHHLPPQPGSLQHVGLVHARTWGCTPTCAPPPCAPPWRSPAR